MTPDEQVTPLYVTPERVARTLGVSANHIRKLTVKGDIPSVRIGQAIRIPASYLAQFEGK